MIMADTRKSQQMGSQASNNGVNLTFLSGGGNPTNFKGLKLRAAEFDGGRNKSPSLSKSMNDH